MRCKAFLMAGDCQVWQLAPEEMRKMEVEDMWVA